MIETVKEHCEHEDCIYRGKFGSDPCCQYILIAEKRRGCKISECDKYAAGTVSIVSTMGGFMVKDYDI